MYGNDCMNIEKLLSNDLSILSLLFSAYMFEANLANRGLSTEAILAIFWQCFDIILNYFDKYKLAIY